MKAGGQFLVATRLLSTTPGFSAVLTLFTSSRHLTLFCKETSVVGFELDGKLPAGVESAGTTDQEKIAAFQKTLSQPENKAALLAAIPAMLNPFFTADLMKCELKARLYSGEAVLTFYDLLRDYASKMLGPNTFEELLPKEASFQLAPGAIGKSTRFAFSAQDGYLLSRLEHPLGIGEIVSLIPADEDQTRRTVMMLWAAGVLNSAALEKFVPKLPNQAPRMDTLPGVAPRMDTKPGVAPPKPVVDHFAAAQQARPADPIPESPLDDVDVVNQTYTALGKKDFYSVLGVPSRSELPEIKVAYYRLAKRFHPDRFYGVNDAALKEKVDVIFSAINVAYETLKNAKSRTAYDNIPAEQKKVESTTLLTQNKQEPVDRDEAMQKVAEDYYKRAQGAFDTNNFYQAVQFLRSATQIDPYVAKYWRQLGISLSKNPQWKKEAEDSFNRAMELEPKNPENHLYLGFLYKNLNLKLRAKKHFASCLELDPHNDLAIREYNLIDAEEKAGPQDKKGLLGGIFKKK